MQRRQVIRLLAGAALALGPAGTALAQGMVDSVVRQLRQQGYRDFVIEKTWLGRTRIIGMRGRRRREIVLDTRTGEILRDVMSGGDSVTIRDDRSDSSGSSSSGSGSSGSGSGGSGSGGDDDSGGGRGRGRGRGGDDGGQGRGRGRGGDDG